MSARALALAAICLALLVGCAQTPVARLWATPTPEPPLFREDMAVATAEAAADPRALADELVRRGDARASQGDHEGALADYTRAIELAPDSSRAYNNRAIASEALGRTDAALADYAAAIAIDGRYLRAYRNRAALLERTGGDMRLLAADYGQIAELEPSQAGVYRYRQGSALHQLRDLTGARAAYDAALAADPQQVDALYERALLSFAEGRPTQAIQDLDRAIRLSPRAANAYYARGLARSTAGDRAGALADLTRALELTPEDPQALLARAAIRLADGDRAGGSADLAQLERLPLPDDLAAAAAALRQRYGE